MKQLLNKLLDDLLLITLVHNGRASDVPQYVKRPQA